MQLTEEMEIFELSFIKRGRNRKKVMNALSKGMKTNKQISKETGILQRNVSTTLKQLGEHELVKCTNPKVRQGKLFKLTEKGEELNKFL